MDGEVEVDPSAGDLRIRMGVFLYREMLSYLVTWYSR